jgi:small subunit ribosomal protein S9
MIKAKATTTKTTAPKTAKARSVAPIAHGVGRRKSSIARIWLRPGKGSIVVNGKDFKEYFETEVTRLDASKVFRVMTVELNFDVVANVTGGGNCSQAGAVQLGIARAILAANEGLRPMLRQHELLTVDSRVKERKKYGQKAARRKFQFVKR